MSLNKLGRYDIIKPLGKGSMGLVYEAHDPTLERHVAIKTIHVAEFTETTATEYESRFRAEARAGGRLQHPNIIGVYDAGRDEGVAYMVMELVRGGDLKQLLEQGTRLPFERSYAIMRELLGALHFAHEQGIIHRDVKPANVMLDAGGHVKLGDFGVARITNSGELTRTQGSMVGTLKYMSPEQVQGLKVDSRTDLFAAGVVLYQLLTGLKPFEGTNDFTIMQAILQHEPAPAISLDPTLPAGIDAVIAKALAKDREQRYATARDFMIDLRATALPVLGGTFPPSAVPSPTALWSQTLVQTADTSVVDISGGPQATAAGELSEVDFRPDTAFNPRPVARREGGGVGGDTGAGDSFRRAEEARKLRESQRIDDSRAQQDADEIRAAEALRAAELRWLGGRTQGAGVSADSSQRTTRPVQTGGGAAETPPLPYTGVRPPPPPPAPPPFAMGGADAVPSLDAPEPAFAVPPLPSPDANATAGTARRQARLPVVALVLVVLCAAGLAGYVLRPKPGVSVADTMGPGETLVADSKPAPTVTAPASLPTSTPAPTPVPAPGTGSAQVAAAPSTLVTPGTPVTPVTQVAPVPSDGPPAPAPTFMPSPAPRAPGRGSAPATDSSPEPNTFPSVPPAQESPAPASNLPSAPPPSLPPNSPAGMYIRALSMDQTDPAGEVKLLVQAADRQYGPAATRLWEVFRDGRGPVSPDPRKAAAWYTAAKRFGEPVPDWQPTATGQPPTVRGRVPRPYP